MSKLLIPNTTQVPNVLLDVVMPQIKNASLRVLLAIVRKTYGFGKRADKISLTQLQRATGLSRQGVVNGIGGLGKLLESKVGKGINEYSLNLDVSTGQLVNAVDQSINLTSQVCGSQGSQRSRHTKPIITKPKNPTFSSTIEKIVTRLNELSGRSYRANSKAVCKYLRARLKAGATEADCLAVVENRWESWGTSEKMRPHFNPVVLFREENFVRYLEDARAGNENDRAPEVRDLGGGMVEVDGVQMEKKTYELRYGRAG